MNLLRMLAHLWGIGVEVRRVIELLQQTEFEDRISQRCVTERDERRPDTKGGEALGRKVRRRPSNLYIAVNKHAKKSMLTTFQRSCSHAVQLIINPSLEVYM